MEDKIIKTILEFEQDALIVTKGIQTIVTPRSDMSNIINIKRVLVRLVMSKYLIDSQINLLKKSGELEEKFIENTIKLATLVAETLIKTESVFIDEKQK